MARKKASSILEFALIFAVVYLVTQMGMQWFFPQPSPEQLAQNYSLKPIDTTVKEGHHPEVTLVNQTEEPLELGNTCPMPPLDVFLVQNPNTSNEQLLPLETTDTAIDCELIETVPAGGSVKISLAPWKYSLFGTLGTYEVQLPTADTEAEDEEGDAKPQATTRFSIEKVGIFTQLFRTFVTEPLFNLLIFIAGLVPSHSLGLAIILLTLAVKLVLFFPTQHALEGQKEMQKLQPKLEALKKKHKENPQKLQQETMKLWKEHKINPFQSCLPMLLQFPVLIGLFFVIRDGSVIELSQHLLYEVHQSLPWRFETNFLGMNLLEPSWYVMPPILVIMQFLQMKLSFSIAKKKKEQKEGVVDVTPKEKKKKKEKKNDSLDMASMQQTQQKVMLYGLPLMIGVFAFQFPAAVSLYWLMSTLFAIGQQIVVNRKTL